MRRRDALPPMGVAALLGSAAFAAQSAEAALVPLPDKKLLDSNPEAYWSRIRREQFVMPPGRAFLNNGSLGVIPKPVIAALTGYVQRAAALEVREYPRWGYETLDQERTEMAGFLGCKRDELAFVHNCTEAMSIIANGLDLAQGDEVLITDQEHTGGISCWKLKEARAGIALRTVKIPVAPANPGELTDRIIGALTPRTRVLSFSGITTTTGLILPVREICRAAREKGALTVVDGAHMNGQIPVSLEDLGCDYYAGSPHKWMFAPAGCGLLYGREEMLDRLWPVTVSGGWDNKKDLRAARFMMVGTNNRAIFHGMVAGLRFLKDLGPETVFARQRQLARRVLDMVKQRNYLELVTPEDERLHGAVVTIRFKTADLRGLFEAMEKQRIWILGGQQMRLSVHVHTRPGDIDALFAVADKVLGA